jgi:tetraacyldisaccharide 4'-kinase
VGEALSPAILCRGYKSFLGKKEVLILLAGKVFKKNFTRNLSSYPDEAMMYSNRMPTVPIIIGKDRTFAAQWFLQQNAKPSHWILDDGFQHRKIERDLDIVLLDAISPFGNGRILPLGSLREPISSLRRANCICFTRSTPVYPLPEIDSLVKKYSTAAAVKLFFDFTIHSLNNGFRFSKSHEPVLVVCGIAQPEKFLLQIEEKGIGIGETYIVGDHDPFDGKKMQDLLKNCNSILCTEKDYWRNPSIFNNANKPCFLTELRIFPTETDKQSIFDIICRLKKIE